MLSLELLVRLGCHLCEDAASLLTAEGVIFQRINVDSELKLREEYGLLVPVLRTQDGRELHYPFDAHSVKIFLHRINE